MPGWMDKIADWVNGKLGPGNADRRIQYVFIAVLVLIIVAALAATFVPMIGGGSQLERPEEIHFQCTETGKAYILKTEDIADHLAEIEERGEPFATAKFTNPDTGRQTLMATVKCLGCGKRFLPKGLDDPAGAPTRRCEACSPSSRP